MNKAFRVYKRSQSQSDWTYVETYTVREDAQERAEYLRQNGWKVRVIISL